MKTKIIAALIVFATFQIANVYAQEKNDTLVKKQKSEKPAVLTPYHKNVIKFNPTPMLLFGNVRNITFSYERMINKTQSLAVQVGYLLFPKLINDTIVNLINITGNSKNGVNLAFDYRYYPFSRNRRPAPDGIYIGGYASYYGFQFKNNLDILQTTVDQNAYIKGRLNVVNVGVMLGYQFIFWKRFSLDMLMFGPAYSIYSGNLEINGELDEDQINDVNKEMVDALLNRFPILGQIFSDDALKFTGTRTKFGIGLRYSIQLGFHF